MIRGITPDLGKFENSWYKPGRGPTVEALWFFLGLPVLKSALNPFSSLRRFLLNLFGAEVGAGVVLKPGLKVKYPWKLAIGANSWIGEDCWIDNLEQVIIGSNVCISQGAYLCTGNHDWSDPTFGLIVKPIRIGDGCWVGAKTVIAPGIELGECAIALAGSVITKGIPALEIHAGNPAKFIRHRVIRTEGEREANPPSALARQS